MRLMLWEAASPQHCALPELSSDPSRQPYHLRLQVHGLHRLLKEAILLGWGVTLHRATARESSPEGNWASFSGEVSASPPLQGVLRGLWFWYYKP